MHNSCGTPLGHARADLMVLGDLATRPLSPLLDDPSPERAAFVAELLVDAGDARRVLSWCAARDLRRDPAGRELCQRALVRLAGVASISANGIWRGETYQVDSGREDPVRLEFRVHGTADHQAAEV